jgi:hypothetical protein
LLSIHRIWSLPRWLLAHLRGRGEIFLEDAISGAMGSLTIHKPVACAQNAV